MIEGRIGLVDGVDHYLLKPLVMVYRTADAP
jgi:hypothetical protein